MANNFLDTLSCERYTCAVDICPSTNCLTIQEDLPVLGHSREHRAGSGYDYSDTVFGRNMLEHIMLSTSNNYQPF